MNNDNRPHWTRLRETIEQAGGAWPPPGTREVERAIERPTRNIDYERLTRLELKRRKLISQIMDGNTLKKQEKREQLFELIKEINAYNTKTSDA